ncbi:hypothetical protein [Antarctobacter jejuensis]|uniref:hypothetical protein n=1 Tax=Antarctobacter jejuensis TaxID=1439938 RepID=UPI003FD13453
MRFHVLASCLCLAAPMAMACPVADDMGKGIRFTVDGTDTEEYRRQSAGLIEVLYITAQGDVTRNLLGQGVYLLEYVDVIDGTPDLSTRTTYAFPGKPEDLKVPEPGASVTYDVVVNYAGDLDKEQQIYSFGQKSLLNFGACEYEMIVAEVRYSPDETETIDYLYYLPEFGFAYYVGSDSVDGATRYIYSNIEVIE